MKQPFPQVPQIGPLRARSSTPLSTVLEHPVDNSSPISARFTTSQARIRRFRGLGAVLYSAPPWSPSSTGCSRRARPRPARCAAPTTRRRTARPPTRLPPQPRPPAGASPRRVAAVRTARPRGPAHRHLRHAHQPAASDRRRRGGPAGAHRLSRGEDLQLVPRAGRAGALHGDPGAHREPAPRRLPRRRGHGPRQRPDHPHLRSRPRASPRRSAPSCPGSRRRPPQQRSFIRGVGSGLPIARESLAVPARRR